MPSRPTRIVSEGLYCISSRLPLRYIYRNGLIDGVAEWSRPRTQILLFVSDGDPAELVGAIEAHEKGGEGG
ncbi:hypothetical protein PG995_011973 [Apiospora arundinis]|uniref:Uncharacterized protein n=1 Tax=Apiospora arundinis TaxID=335852 RepID=A0ABR2HM26_9PEZI